MIRCPAGCRSARRTGPGRDRPRAQPRVRRTAVNANMNDSGSDASRTLEQRLGG
ncbi:hypothetical protein HMPREF9062_0779 [Actinomyces sp. oral taxon 448 str. F0400]|nr:hypothetical protein HMPREF9062_0779 [Actinomyces sp. oral taxon 448 str. F0400]